MTSLASSSLADAMQSVVDAHALLRDFHREVVAFYGLVDTLLLADDVVALEAEDSNNIVREISASLKSSHEWNSRWFGRFYYEPGLWPEEGEESSAGPPTYEQLHTAFVFIAAAPNGDELTDCKSPECVFGVGHVGRDSKAKSFFEAARYGLWNVDLRRVVGREWAEGRTPEKTGKFGTNGFWTARRVPIVELTNEEKICELVTKPLKAKYKERFAQAPKA